jgi:hypothetical protein
MMGPPHGEDAQEEVERKRREAVTKSFDLIEQHPDFSDARIRIHDREQEIENNPPEGTQERLSEPRFEHCILLFDIEGEEYLRLVVDRQSHKAYTAIIDDLMRRVFVLFSGIPLEAVPPTLPFMNGPTPALLLYRDRLLKRMLHWVIEGHRRLASLRKDQPKDAGVGDKQPRKVLEPRPDLLTDLDASANRLKAAQILGITPRTLDRWTADRRLTPIGSTPHKRFRNRDLKRILDQKKLDYRDRK